MAQVHEMYPVQSDLLVEGSLAHQLLSSQVEAKLLSEADGGVPTVLPCAGHLLSAGENFARLER